MKWNARKKETSTSSATITTTTTTNIEIKRWNFGTNNFTDNIFESQSNKKYSIHITKSADAINYAIAFRCIHLMVDDFLKAPNACILPCLLYCLFVFDFFLLLLLISKFYLLQHSFCLCMRPLQQSLSIFSVFIESVNIFCIWSLFVWF